jgi:hypothetical protein
MKSSAACVAVTLVIFAIVTLIQFRGGVFEADLASHPDEAAHFITGAMVYDYVRTAIGSSPMAFAEEYYARYPKVAFGHWPPGFYGIQAAWYALFGVSTTAAMSLVGFVAALAIAVLAWRIYRLHGVWISAVCTAITLALPLVQQAMLTILSDMLAALFTLLALFALADAWERPSLRAWVGFCGWMIAALATKSSALSLAVVAPLAALPLLRGSSWRPRSWWVVTGIVIALVGAAAAALGVVLRYRGSTMFAINWLERLPHLASLLSVVPWPVGLMAAAGLFRDSRAGTERPMLVKVLVLFLATSIPAQLFARDVVEPRYFLPLLFAILLLCAEGLHRLFDRLPAANPRKRLALRLALGVGLVLLTIQLTPAFTSPWRRGYREVARAIPAPSVVLISADASGEGAFIAARRSEGGGTAARTGFVLRASKLLLRSDWMGRVYEPTVTTVEQLHEILDRSGVRFIVLDKTGFEFLPTRPQHRLLLTAVQDSRRFRLAGEFPVTSRDARWGNAIAVYENLLLPKNQSGVVRLDLTNSLGRTLEVHVPSQSDEPDPPIAPPPPVLSNVAATLRLEPAEDQVDWTGGAGKVYVAGPEGAQWNVDSIPPWIRVAETRGAVSYTVEPNDTGERRSAILRIGQRPYPVTQARSPYIAIPYTERFTDWQDRWVLAQHGERAFLRNGPTTPDLGATALVEKARVDPAPHLTQLSLPFVRLEPGQRYQLSFWIKSERRAELEVVLSNKRPPHAFCGFAEKFSATATWTRFSFPLQTAGGGCTPETNRLSFQLGGLSGQLWLADLAILPQ